MELNFRLHGIITEWNGLFVIMMLLNLIKFLGQIHSSFILAWIRRLWEKILAKKSSSANLRLNKIEIFHTHDTPPNTSSDFLLKARYIYGANHIKIIAIN